MNDPSEDEYNLTRFLLAQQNTFDKAISEIQRGRKETHWMWFIFPQFAGLGSSYESELYAIKSLDEAREYLRHPILGPRLVDASEACLKVKRKSANQIFGNTDELKLRSSMTLFAQISPPDSVFHRVLETFYDGKTDQRTLDLIASSE